MDSQAIVAVTDPDGKTRDYVEDVRIPFAGNEYAVLVSIPEDMADEGEPEIILAKIVTGDDGEVEYIPPSDDEYDAVASLYESM